MTPTNTANQGSARARLAEFTGVYRSEELDVEWIVAMRDGRLMLRRPRYTDRVLVPGDRDILRFEDPFEDERFIVDLARRGQALAVGVRIQCRAAAETRPLDRPPKVRDE